MTGVSSLPKPLRNGTEAGLEPTTYKLQVCCPTDGATMPILLQKQKQAFIELCFKTVRICMNVYVTAMQKQD